MLIGCHLCISTLYLYHTQCSWVWFLFSLLCIGKIVIVEKFTCLYCSTVGYHTLAGIVHKLYIKFIGRIFIGRLGLIACAPNVGQ